MTDCFAPEVRTRIMASVRQKDTAPELAVRRLLHGIGYRYGLHRRDLPGKPDLVFASRRKVIFVHGCFWHGHKCKRGRLPTSNVDYWNEKISRNKTRDHSNICDLRQLGWEVCVVWECETTDLDTLRKRVVSFLERD